VINRAFASGILAGVTESSRIAFLLPWKGRALVGTSEVRQQLKEPGECSADERNYLSKFHDSVMEHSIDSEALVETFAGLRPLIRGVGDPNWVSREYELERRG